MQEIDTNQENGKQQRAQTPNLVRLQQISRNIQKNNKIKVDLHKSEYPLLRNVATQEFSWKMWIRQQSKEEVNLFWVDTYVSDEQVRRLKPYQKVNHFPASFELGRKNHLCSNLNKMKRFFPREYNFFPQTWNFPEDINDFNKFTISNPGSFYILKPPADSQGRGIQITNHVDTSSKDEFVVQKYINDPLLIDSMKFDLRIYVLLKSLFPLKIFIFKEGLGRLATSNYTNPDESNAKNVRMHLTNYAINKFSSNYVFNQSEINDNIGHKRSYTAIFQTLEKMGCDIVKLQFEIDQIIVKTILATYQKMVEAYRNLRDVKEDQDSVCFQILGFDIMIKSDYTPILIEVNHSPSFCTDSPLDLVIKKCLITDTYNLLNLSYNDKVSFFKNKIFGDNPAINPISNQKQIAKACTEAEQYQNLHLGAFRRIYPLNTKSQFVGEEVINLQRIETQKVVQKNYEKYMRAALSKKIPRIYKKHDNLMQIAIKMKNPENSSEQIDKIIDFDLSLMNSNLHKFKNIDAARNYRQTAQSISHHKKSVVEDDGDLDLDFIKLNNTIKVSDRSKIKDQFLLKQHQKTKEKEKEKEREREKDKKKMFLPLPCNSVSIKFDDRSTAKIKKEQQTRASITSTSADAPHKIHSFLKTFNQFYFFNERKKGIQAGQKTADSLRQPQTQIMRQKLDDMGLNTSRQRSYEKQLQNKIERMQLARIKLQKIRRIERGGYIIISSKTIQKKDRMIVRAHKSQLNQ